MRRLGHIPRGVCGDDVDISNISIANDTALLTGVRTILRLERLPTL